MLKIRVFMVRHSPYPDSMPEYGRTINDDAPVYSKNVADIAETVSDEFRKHKRNLIGVIFEPEVEYFYSDVGGFKHYTPLGESQQKDFWNEFERFFPHSPLCLYPGARLPVRQQFQKRIDPDVSSGKYPI